MSAWDAIFWIALTVFGTGLYVLELSKIAGLVMMLVGAIGMAGWFANAQVTMPLWLRSRKWALREIERMGKDPSHPLHKLYFASSMGYKDISDWDHKRALDAVHALYERAHLGRWKHTPRSKD